jgi:hypothetical protein
MAKKKNGFDTTVLMKYAERLDKLGGTDALKRATEAGMAQAKTEINKQITTAMQRSNLPAGGKYPTGATLASLNTDVAPEWDGNVATLPLGFDMSKSGITSILLMYGTPKMPPVAGLADAVKGAKAQRASRKAQEEAMQKIIERLGG